MADLADRIAGSCRGAVLLLGRLALAAIFVPSGFSKLTHLGTFAGSLAGHGVPAPSLLAVVGACVELFGSLCIVLGLKTRYVAPLMAVFTAIAAVISHHFWLLEGPARAMQYVHFMKNMAIIGGYLVLFAAGPGPYSIDRARL